MRFTRFKKEALDRVRDVEGAGAARQLESVGDGLSDRYRALERPERIEEFLERYGSQVRASQARVGAAAIPGVPSGQPGRSRTDYVSVFLPGCEIPDGYHPDRMAAPSEAAQKVCLDKRTRLCVTHAGFVQRTVLNAAFVAGTTTNVVPNAAKSFWGQEFHAAVFNAGLETRVFNASVNSVTITGRNQFVGGAVPMTGFSEVMPYLGVSWDEATPSNPIEIAMSGIAAANVDLMAMVVGYALR